MRHFLQTAALLIFCPTMALSFCPDVGDSGKFLTPLNGTFFDGGYIKRPVFKLLSDYSYQSPNGDVFTAPANYIVDGASIPDELWSIVGGPFSGKHLNASVVHDFYTDTCQVFAHPEKGRTCESELKVFIEDEIVHENYYRGLVKAGMSTKDACRQYRAVSLYKSWDLDANSRPINIKIATYPIDVIYGDDKDLSDDGKLAKALRIIKYSLGGVFQTLKSTDGEYLNVYPKFTIPATNEGWETYREMLSEAIQNETYLENPGTLGVLNLNNYENYDAIPVLPGDFPSNQFGPVTSEYFGLTDFSAGLEIPQKQFAEDLGLTIQTLIQVPQLSFNPEDIENEESLSTIMEALTGANVTQLGGINWRDGLQLQQNPENGVIKYEMKPSLIDELNKNQFELPLGASGQMIFPQANEALKSAPIFQPNPR